MSSIAEFKKMQEEWREHCRQIQSITDNSSLLQETATQKEQRIRRLQKDYAAFCEYYFPHFLTLHDQVTGEPIRVIHNAPFHNQAALKIKNTPNLKAVFKWPRGHAKSTHIDIFSPLWLMFQPKRLINFMVLVGKSDDNASRLLGDIQAELQYNQRIIADFGPQMSMGDWTEGEFTTSLVDADSHHVDYENAKRVLTTSSSTTSTTTNSAGTHDEYANSPTGSKKHFSEHSMSDVDASSWSGTSSLRHQYWQTSAPSRAYTSQPYMPSTAKETQSGKTNGQRRRRRNTPISSDIGHGTRK